ncbi:phosphonate ABC transporter, permease protein PhnE [Fructobacillus evanidus]|uniref:Permease component (PhnE) n=1 Tax=Fructobacillus evanidus TaxID=3064281 RepID=A0ABM9MSY7_9LACO|nr:ABC-type phosphate/phosphonate transport system [Fructobacillus sp. LMG 32999]CAK1233591.1 ABC-type phosphate/phosphonate transport system [Fructobacillus sp. LMG 32999]CAK1236108.1 ABC-type phosphate/phosphonate transport system [Fructobacillus sp. LMG 32999]CAK1236843.1 ABC-type phosphate/phosphonate transport system [Fructobacillus sp. LMG 32999]CAK1237214.1 ABC-type phosphate/phosphonate transport system [Fructobacillus sp. LMG 32999]
MMIQQKTLWQKSQPWFITVVVAAIFIWGFTGVPLTGIKSTAGQVFGSILDGLMHPDWPYLYSGDGEDLVTALLQTLAIAFLGTFMSAVLAVPFGFWAAKTSRKFFSPKSASGKFVLTVVRVFPELVLAIMFIKAVGPGAFAGVLALGFHSVGMMGKLFSEAVENIDRGPNEAIAAAGGSTLDGLTMATFPAVLPEFMNYTLYRFEIAVRSASILGIVGAGGVGAPLIFALSTRAWPRVGMILIGIVVTVTAIDFLSGQIRKRLV